MHFFITIASLSGASKMFLFSKKRKTFIFQTSSFKRDLLFPTLGIFIRYQLCARHGEGVGGEGKFIYIKSKASSLAAIKLAVKREEHSEE